MRNIKINIGCMLIITCLLFMVSCVEEEISDTPAPLEETGEANIPIGELLPNERVMNIMKNGKISDLEWPIFRGDRGYSGHSAGAGNITSEPKTIAYIDMGMYDAYISLSGADGESTISYSTGDIASGAPGDINDAWGLLNYQRIEIETEGEYVTVAQSQTLKYAQMYKDSEKYYLVEVTETPFNTRQDFASNLVRIYEYGKEGRGEMLWEEPLPEYIERPQLCVYDMTGDGDKDIIVVGWQGAAVMDARGNQVAFLSQNTKGWHQLRKRGYVCAQDIDGDGYGEIIIIGCFPYHVDMIDFDGKDLSFGWTHIYDDKIERAFKVSKALTNSVGDFDGDGKFEVLVNVYNDKDDGKWHATIYDAVSGEEKYDIPGAYAYNIADADGDGKHEIFCVEAAGQAIPEKGSLKIYKLDNMPAEIFSIANASYMKPRIYTNPDNVVVHGSTAPEGEGIVMLTDEKVLLADIDGDGALEFFIITYNDDGSTAINAYKITDGKAQKAALEIQVPSGIKGTIMRSDKDGALLLKLRSMGDGGFDTKIKGMEAQGLGRYKADSYRFSSPIIADIDNDGFLEIIATNDIGQIVCYKKAPSGFDELWRIEGRGMTYQYISTYDYGVCVADVNNDGFLEILISSEGESGAAIKLYSHEGKLIWSHEFKDIYAGAVETFSGNIAFFNFTKMSEGGGLDVVVTVQRVIQHTGKTYVLSGKDGSIIYEYDEIEVPKDGLSLGGMGGYGISSCDIDGDGFEEIFGGYGNAVWGIDGKTGDYLFKRFMTGMYTAYNKDYQIQFPNFWVSSIIPVPFRSSDGEYKLFASNAGLGGGSISLDGEVIKAADTIETDGALWQALADIDGDKKLWVAEICGDALNPADISLRIYDPETLETYPGGAIKQPELYTSAYSYVVSGDINGDGKDEILFNSYNGLIFCYGIKPDGSFGELWKCNVGKNIGSLALADGDSDGYVDIIVSALDGSILILG